MAFLSKLFGRGNTPQEQFKNFPFAYILEYPPAPIQLPIQVEKCDPSQAPKYSQQLRQIFGVMLNYNKTEWNFGNIIDNAGNIVAIHPLLSKQTYSQLLNKFSTKMASFPVSYPARFSPGLSEVAQGYFHPNYQPSLGYQAQMHPRQLSSFGFQNPGYYAGEMRQVPGGSYNFQYGQLFNSLTGITEKIDNILKTITQKEERVCLVNTFFPLNVGNLFAGTQIPNLARLTLKVTPLGLAVLMGAEHLVIYFLSMGANPSLKNLENKDSAYDFLHIQLTLHEMLRRESLKGARTPVGFQGQFGYQRASGQFPFGQIYQGNISQTTFPIPHYYFVVDQRIEYILTLLGSVRGIDLSAIVKTEVPTAMKILNASSTQSVKYKQTNILCFLSKEDILLNDMMIYGHQSMMNANTAYNILSFVLTYNNFNMNGKSLHFFDDVNSQEIPTGITPLFYVLGNRTLVNIEQKVDLIKLFISQGADPTILPDWEQMTTVKMPFFKNICNLIQLYYQGPVYQQINSVLSENKKYVKQCQTFVQGRSAQDIISEYQRQIAYLTKETEFQANVIRQLREGSSEDMPEEMQSSQELSPPLPTSFSTPYSNETSLNTPRISESYQPGLTSEGMENFSGGKKIQLRTFHFPKGDKFSGRAFRAVKPKIAAENAYDFIKTKYNISKKEIMFTIEDREKDKKYNYTGRTNSKGEDIIKSI